MHCVIYFLTPNHMDIGYYSLFTVLKISTRYQMLFGNRTNAQFTSIKVMFVKNTSPSCKSTFSP